MSIGCTKADGTIIKPGDSGQPTPTPLPTPIPRPVVPTSAPSFSGIGFPGLAPVDFAEAVAAPLLLDEKVTGVIPLDNQILGFTLDAEAGDTLDLSYTRASGNMNLGGGGVVRKQRSLLSSQPSHVGVVVDALHFTGSGAVYDWRLPHQPGRASGGGADGVSTGGHDSGVSSPASMNFQMKRLWLGRTFSTTMV